MIRAKVIISVAVFAASVFQAAAVEVRIAPDRVLLANGVRTFVIGLYENPREDDALAELARAGFNLIQACDDTAVLDQLQKHGLYGWINTGGRIALDPGAADQETQLADMAGRFAAHPALLAWEGPDESLWMCAINALRSGGAAAEIVDKFNRDADALTASLTAGYERLKQLDPNHPVWLNHAAGNSLERLARLGHAADIVGADIYPLMPYPTRPIDYSRSGLGWVGSCTHKMQASAPGKPVWMVLQGMSWGSLQNDVFTLRPQPGQWPTFEESRFMAYDAIVRGARGVLYWGTPYLDKDSECWRGLLKVVRELADNQTLLAAPDAPLTFSIQTKFFGFVPNKMVRPPLNVQALGKDVDGKVWWLVVNEYFVPVTYALSGLAPLEGVAYTDTASGRTSVVKQGVLTGALPRYGVHVLRPSLP